MNRSNVLVRKITAVALATLLVFSGTPFALWAVQLVPSGTGSDAYTTAFAAETDSSEGAHFSESLNSGSLGWGESGSKSAEAADGQEQSVANEGASTENGKFEPSVTAEASSDDSDVAGGSTTRDAKSFAADAFISKFSMSLSSDGVSKSYELSGAGVIDTRADFPNGLSRSSTYVANISIDTKSLLEAQDAYPFVEGDTLTCRVPDIINTGDGITSGRLRDATAEWDSEHDGVGSYSVAKDADGHNMLTITYDDGYIDEKSGKVLSSSVRLSGGFNTSQSTDAFDADLIFGGLTVKTTFSKLEIVRNLSIEKTGTIDESGRNLSYSTPSTVRKGSALLDGDGYLTYSITVTAGQDNTYKLTNVEVRDIFDTASKAKVDLSSMTLVSSVVDSVDKTSSAVALYDANGFIEGWNIGDLPIGASAVVTFKVKLDKEGVTAAVDAAKAADSSTDALEARTIKNTASASADGTNSVSDDYATTVESYVSVTKTKGAFVQDEQRQHFTILVTAPSDNRYILHDVPIHDYLSSGALESSCYGASGINSMSVKHSDGTTESLSWDNYQQIASNGQADTRSWYATISEIRPGDVVTIDAYLELDESYWSHAYNRWTVGNGNSTYNQVYVGNLGENGYYASDINKIYSWAYFSLSKYLVSKSGTLDSTNGTIRWSISGNEAGKSKDPIDIGGTTIADELGANQKFTGNTANVTFYGQDGEVVGRDSFVLADGSTSFTYVIPSQYGTCQYRIEYSSTVTDWDTYVGPAKSYSNEVNGYTAWTNSRSRVAAMDKRFVEQADDWSRWKTEIYSELQSGDTYTDYSNDQARMYFTDDDISGIALSIDGVALDESLYEIEPTKAGSSEKYRGYTIAFKDNVSVMVGNDVVKPSKDHPLVISYKAHMVNPSSGSCWYYNYGTLNAGNVSDRDYDYCIRANSSELDKSVTSSSNGFITWKLQVNRYGYAAQPDGTCVVTDTLPAGLSYESIAKLDGVGDVDYVDAVSNSDGTTTLSIHLSGLYHDEVCKTHTTDHNSWTSTTLGLSLKTRITDEDYLYGSTSKSFDFTNTLSLSDRYGNSKTASATTNIDHVAMKKTMTYSDATAPYAQFSIDVNADKVDLNPDGDTVRIVDESSKSLSIDLKSISVVDASTGDPVDFAVDASQMASNTFVVEVPDNTHVKISYQAQVVGVVGQPVQVSNNAYYEGHKTDGGESSISQTVTVLNSSGQADSEPMVWFSKRGESAQALAGATYKLDVYNEASDVWESVRSDIVSTDGDGKGVKVESLELNKLYRLVETVAPSDYALDATPHYFVLYKDSNPTVKYPDGVNPDDVFQGPSGSLISAYDSPYTKVRFIKSSDDGAQLGGAEFSVYSVASDGTVSATPALDKDGNEVVFASSESAASEFVIAAGTYKIVETKAPDGYAIATPVIFEVKGDAQRSVIVGGQTVQSGSGDAISGGLGMTDASAKTSLKVSKVWDDAVDFDGVRPQSATVQLVANGELVQGETLELSASNDWQASFTNLDIMKNGAAIQYSVKEIDPGTGDAVDSGSVLSNGYSVAVSATAGDAASAANNGYSLTVTNSYAPKTTAVYVSKVWDDDNNQDGMRPTDISVQLFADGNAIAGKVATLDDGNDWQAGFDDLPSAGQDGDAIVYTVKEIDPDTGELVDFGHELSSGYVPGLSSSSYAGYPDGVNPTGIDGASGSSSDTRSIAYGITNVRAAGTATIEVSKKWVGPAADSASLVLQSSDDDGATWTDIAGGQVVLDASNDWSASFDGLSVFAPGHQGVKLLYRIVEESIDGYETQYAVDGKTDSGGVVEPVAGQVAKVEVVNTNIEKVEVRGNKVWDDAENHDGSRPQSIVVRLLADGVEVAVESVSASDDSNAWSFSFGDVSRYDSADGHQVTYTVEEDSVEGYTSKVEGSVESGFTITNARESDSVLPGGESLKKIADALGLPTTGDGAGTIAALLFCMILLLPALLFNRSRN